MCLTQLDDIIEVNTDIGYKVMLSIDDVLFFPYHGIGIQVQLTIGSELTALDSRLRIDDGYNYHVYYDSGFHIFLNEADANAFVRNLNDMRWLCESFKYSRVFRVKFSEVRAKGYQGEAKCVVTKKMTLLEQVDVPTYS